MSDGRLPRVLAFASAAAVGLAAVLPWVGFVGTPVIARSDSSRQVAILVIWSVPSPIQPGS